MVHTFVSCIRLARTSETIRVFDKRLHVFEQSCDSAVTLFD